MKRDRQIVEDRQNNILSLLRQCKKIRVDELADVFNVSLMTIRRDLQHLEDLGLVTRFYGGAAMPEQDSENDEESGRISVASYAADLIGDGESIFINGSKTALCMLSYLHQQGLHIYTNNARAATMSFPSGTELTLSGGNVQGQSGILTGDDALRNLLSLHVDKAFIGCTGISPQGEVLCGIPTELPVNETMIEHSDSYYILADHTKIGVTGNYASWHLEKMGTVITDESAPADVLDQLRSIGMTVIMAVRHG